MQVFLVTNRFKEKDPQYGAQAGGELAQPTNYTPALIFHACRFLSKIYRPGYRYKKAGVIFCGLIPQQATQLDLFERTEKIENKDKLMGAVDKINKRFGRNTVQFGSMGFQQRWKMRAESKSPAYTTRWSELAVVKAI